MGKIFYAIEPLQKRKMEYMYMRMKDQVKIMWNLFKQITNKHEILHSLFLQICVSGLSQLSPKYIYIYLT